MHIELDIDIPEALAEDIRTAAEPRGRALTPDEVSRLAARLRAVRRASGDDTIDPPDRDGMLRRSVRVGDVTLHSPTYAANICLRRIMVWNAADPDLFDQDGYDLLQAYILAHAYSREKLALLASPDTAAAAAAEWGVGLTCTPEELQEAIEILTTTAYPDSVPAGKADPPESTDALMRRYGSDDPEHWLFDLPASLLAHLADGANSADAKVAARQAQAAGRMLDPEHDAKFKTMNAYDDELAEITRG